MRRGRMTLRTPRTTAAAGLLVLVAVVAALLAGQAFGRSLDATVTAATNPALGARIVVDRHGRTLYVLSPETAHQLLCTSRQCLAAWPPATVSSAHAKLTLGTGVTGRLGTLRRSDGRFQLTLRGHPLYRFVADHAKGQANGNGIRNFGGTWHALAPTGGFVVVKKPATTTPPTTPTTTTPAATTPAPTPPAPAPTPPPMTTTTPPTGYTY
jgi:predicted lipoprotein with Yx(FWY)xxD motif